MAPAVVGSSPIGHPSLIPPLKQSHPGIQIVALKALQLESPLYNVPYALQSGIIVIEATMRNGC